MTVPADLLTDGSQPVFLDWRADVPLSRLGTRAANRSAGFTIGAALVLALLAGSTSAILLQSYGWIGWLLAAIFAGFAGFRWLAQRHSSSRSTLGTELTWPVRFGVHDLGAEAVINTPPKEVAVQLLYALRSQADPPPKVAFLSGLMDGVRSTWRASDAMDEAQFGVDVRWEHVIAVAADEREGVIDLSAEYSPGLRLYCTTENFAEVRRFVRRHLPLRFWDALDGGGGEDELIRDAVARIDGPFRSRALRTLSSLAIPGDRPSAFPRRDFVGVAIAATAIILYVVFRRFPGGRARYPLTIERAKTSAGESSIYSLTLRNRGNEAETNLIGGLIVASLRDSVKTTLAVSSQPDSLLAQNVTTGRRGIEMSGIINYHFQFPRLGPDESVTFSITADQPLMTVYMKVESSSGATDTKWDTYEGS